MLNGEKLEEGQESSNYIHIIRIGTFDSKKSENIMDDKWRDAAPGIDIKSSSWIRIFRAFDMDHDGFIQCKDMQKSIRDSTYSFGFDHYEIQKMDLFLEMREGKPIDFTDFCYLMSKCKGYKMRTFLFKAAMTVTPKNQRIDVFSKLQQYKCLPPPMFMFLFSLIQLIFYIYYVIDSKEGIWLSGPIPTISQFIMSPHHYEELWRFFTYWMVNVGILNLVFNVCILLFIGIPLEIVHSWRIPLLYFFGVIFGALIHMSLDPMVFLMGGACGSFAILASHLITLILNFKQMENAPTRLPLIIILVIVDFGLAVYHRYYTTYRIDKISYYGHIGGFIAGILFNFILLKGSKPSRCYTISFWVSLVLAGFYIAICLTLILAPNFLMIH